MASTEGGFEPPSAKENLFFHPGIGETVGSGGTPRKRNRFRRQHVGPGSGNRSPLGSSGDLRADADVAAAPTLAAAHVAAHASAEAGGAAAHRGVTITAEQMADLTAEERALIAKLSARLPTLQPAQPAQAPTSSQPSTPPPASKADVSPPQPPPPPQPPTPLDSAAAAAGASASSSSLFTVGAGGPPLPPPRGRKPASPTSSKQPPHARASSEDGAAHAPAVFCAPPLHHSSPTAGVASSLHVSPIEVAMTEAEHSPVFSIGADEDRAPRSAGRRAAAAKPTSSRGPRRADEAAAAHEPRASLEERLHQLGLDPAASAAAAARSDPAASSAAAPPPLPSGLFEAAAAVPVTFSVGADEPAPGAPRRTGRRKPNVALPRSATNPTECARGVDGGSGAPPPAGGPSAVPSAAERPVAAQQQQQQPSGIPKPRNAWDDLPANKENAPATTMTSSSGGGAPAASSSDAASTARAGAGWGARGADKAADTAADTTANRAADTAADMAAEQVEDPAWRLAEEQKERGNRRYAIKSWAEANACYHKAIGELKKHASWGTPEPEGKALATKAASYHANSAAALMQQGRMADAVAECDASLRADRRLGKALLRVAHVQLMLGDTDEARRYYVEAATVGQPAESEAGLKACADDEQQAARLHAELIMCRRAAASTVGSASSSAQLKGLLHALETACARAPHNIALRSLQAEALSASGRMTEAHALCEAQLSTTAAHKGHAALWQYTLGRVLYDSSLLPEAADKLAESLSRPHAPPGAKPLARLVQLLEKERSEGNTAFKQGQWTSAVDSYTRALAVDPTHARFNSLLYCNRGAAHAKNNALQQALADCSAAIALNRSYAKAYLRRGELRARCGDRSRALEDLGAAQRLDASGPVGQEAQRRVAELRKEQAREAANAAAGAKAGSQGWDRARANYGPGAGSSGYGSSSSSSRGGGGAGTFSAAAKTPNYYDVLGLESGCDADAIRKAYKKLCLKYHPDKHASSPAADKAKAQQSFIEVQKAYDVLSDPAQKRTYDLERARSRGFSGFGGARAGFGFGAAEDDLFSAFYGRHGRPGSRR